MIATPAARASRGKRAALLSGFGLVLLAALGVFHGRTIYCAWLQSWLAGRWESIGTIRQRGIVWEFEPGGKVEKRIKGLDRIEIIAADYRLEGDELVPGPYSDRYADKRYRILPAGFGRFRLDGPDAGYGIPELYRRARDDPPD